MNLIRLVNEAKSTSFKKNIKRLLRKYWGNILFHKQIVSKLRKDYSYVYRNFSPTPSYLDNDSEFKVWIMWWQGEKNMPDIIRICYNSVLQNSKGCEVILITEENYKEYISLPEYILHKFKSGIIPIAQFSDIIRFSLLAKHGGLWLDSTTLITNYNLIQLKDQFFTYRFKTKSQSTPTLGRWSITIISGPSSCIIFHLMKNLLLEYWKKENTLLKYFLTDYFFALIYTDIPEVKRLINSNPWFPSNFLLKEFINTPFFHSYWNNFSNEVHFHTLSRKVSYTQKTRTDIETYYGYLFRTLNNNANDKE